MSAVLLKVLANPNFANSLGFPEAIRSDLLNEKTRFEQQKINLLSIEGPFLGGQQDIFFKAFTVVGIYLASSLGSLH